MIDLFRRCNFHKRKLRNARNHQYFHKFWISNIRLVLNIQRHLLTEYTSGLMSKLRVYVPQVRKSKVKMSRNPTNVSLKNYNKRVKCDKY